MSLLLDALNKADQERKRNDASPSIHSAHENAQNTQRFSISTTLLTLGIIALLTALLISVYWLGKITQKTNDAQIATAHNHSQSTNSKNSAPLNSSMAAPINTTTNENKNQLESNRQTQNSIKKTDSLTPQESEHKPDETVASLYQQKNNAPSTHSEDLNRTPETHEVKTIDPLNSINQFANLPEIHDLPPQILNKIPSLNYSEHNFNQTGGSVKINGQIKHINEQVADTVVIDKILEDGMILHVETYMFKMRALNSWVNM